MDAFEKWMETVEGISALSWCMNMGKTPGALVARCLRAAFEAGRIEGRVEGMGPKLEAAVRAAATEPHSGDSSRG